MTGATITLPIRVDVATGARLTPRGDNPKATCPWVEGAADTVSHADRAKYEKPIAVLKQKQDAARARRKAAA